MITRLSKKDPSLAALISDYMDPKVEDKRKEDAFAMIEIKKDKIVDMNNDYLHLIITSGQDRASDSTVCTVSELNSMMKHAAVNFKTACIQFQAKSDEKLREDLIKICLSCQVGLRSSNNSDDEVDDGLDHVNEANQPEHLKASLKIDHSLYLMASSRSIHK